MGKIIDIEALSRFKTKFIEKVLDTEGRGIHFGTETDYPLSAAHTAYPMGVTLIYTAASTSYPYGTGTVVTIRSASARCVQFSFGNSPDNYKLRTADSNGWSSWENQGQFIHFGTETDYPLSATIAAYKTGITLMHVGSSTSYPYKYGNIVTIRVESVGMQFAFNYTPDDYKLRTVVNGGWSDWKDIKDFSVITGLQKAIGIVVDGNKAASTAAIDQFVVLKNSSISGCPDGLYTAAKAIPANTAIDNTYLTAVSGGGLNVLRDNIATRTLAVQNSEAIAAGTVKSFRIGTAYAGYTPIGIVSISGSGTTGLVLQEFYLDANDNDVVIYYRNVTSNSITPTLIRATILYKRN